MIVSVLRTISDRNSENSHWNSENGGGRYTVNSRTPAGLKKTESEAFNRPTAGF